ncbi:MAG TPA: hypothetical protein VHG92_10855 [Afifellaceae bacterium]|nr:hypothetical protein [Afifellaceae bacterium]
MKREFSFAAGRWLLAALLAISAVACQPREDVETRLVSATHGDALPARAALRSAEDKRSKPPRSTAARSTQDSDKRHFIEFRSRYALSYGHAYVIFGRLNARGEMVNPEVAGLAPKSDAPSVYVAGHFLPVASSTGWTDGDLEDEYMTANWRVMLTEAEYDKVVADIRKLQASAPAWHAALYNCNAFVGDIARSMGYRAPFHWLRPRQYITRLREMNGGPDAIGVTRSTDRAPPGFTEADA